MIGGIGRMRDWPDLPGEVFDMEDRTVQQVLRGGGLPELPVGRTAAKVAAPASYEVSTKGDKRFSALNARLADGRTIEEAYQLDVKGYRDRGNDWRLGKGRPPLRSMSEGELYGAYEGLWRQWAQENPELIQDLKRASAGKQLVDRFARTPVNQARALTAILSEVEDPMGRAGLPIGRTDAEEQAMRQAAAAITNPQPSVLVEPGQQERPAPLNPRPTKLHRFDVVDKDGNYQRSEYRQVYDTGREEALLNEGFKAKQGLVRHYKPPIRPDGSIIGAQVVTPAPIETPEARAAIMRGQGSLEKDENLGERAWKDAAAYLSYRDAGGDPEGLALIRQTATPGTEVVVDAITEDIARRQRIGTGRRRESWQPELFVAKPGSGRAMNPVEHQRYVERRNAQRARFTPQKLSASELATGLSKLAILGPEYRAAATAMAEAAREGLDVGSGLDRGVRNEAAKGTKADRPVDVILMNPRGVSGVQDIWPTAEPLRGSVADEEDRLRALAGAGPGDSWDPEVIPSRERSGWSGEMPDTADGQIEVRVLDPDGKIGTRQLHIEDLEDYDTGNRVPSGVQEQAKEILADTKTPLRSLENLRATGRFVQDPRLEKVGLAGLATMAGKEAVQIGELIQGYRGDQRTPVFIPKWEGDDLMTIDVTRPDPRDRRNSVVVEPELAVRVGNPLPYDYDAQRPALAQLLGAEGIPSHPGLAPMIDEPDRSYLLDMHQMKSLARTASDGSRFSVMDYAAQRPVVSPGSDPLAALSVLQSRPAALVVRPGEGVQARTRYLMPDPFQAGETPKMRYREAYVDPRATGPVTTLGSSRMRKHLTEPGESAYGILNAIANAQPGRGASAAPDRVVSELIRRGRQPRR